MFDVGLIHEVGRQVYHCIQSYSDRLGYTVEELNVQPDHIHLLIRVPPKQNSFTFRGLFPCLKNAQRRGRLRWFLVATIYIVC